MLNRRLTPLTLFTLILAVAVLALTPTASYAGGALYQGDDQGVEVRNAAGSTYSRLNNDGTVNLGAEILSAGRLVGIEGDVDSIEVRIGDIDFRLGSSENAIDQIRSVDLPSKMDLVTSGVSAEVVLKMDAEGQAVAAGFNDGNVFLRDGTRDMQADINMASHKIVNLLAGVSANDAVTKAQLDAAISGLDWKNPVQAFNLVGNADVTTLNGLTPAFGDQYVVTDAGTLTTGSLAVVAGDIVEFTGTAWQKIVSGSGGFVPDGTRAILAKAPALVSPYTDGVDDGKIITFDGLSNTGVSTGEAYDEASLLVQDLGHISVFDNRAYVFEGSVPTGSWVQFAGAGQYSDGDGLDLIGTTFNVLYDDATISLDGNNKLIVKAGGIANTQISASAAIAESKLALDYSTTSLNSAITSHTGDATIHRSISDTTTTETNLWSASKINAELVLKAAAVHTHVAADITDFAATVRSSVSASGILSYNSGTGDFSLANSAIDHDALTNFVAAEHTPLNDAATTESNLWSASYTLAQISAAVAAADISSKATLGGDTLGMALSVGTNDNYDFVLKAGGVGYINLNYDAVNPTVDIAYPVNVAGAYQTLKSGRRTVFAGDKINIAETTDVAFASIDVAASSSVVVRVIGAAYVDNGAAVDGGEWLVTLRRDASNNVAVSQVQQIQGIDGGAQDVATADIAFADMAVTAVAVDADTVNLRVNAEITGTTVTTSYGFDYSLEVVGRGVTLISNL